MHGISFLIIVIYSIIYNRIVTLSKLEMIHGGYVKLVILLNSGNKSVFFI